MHKQKLVDDAICNDFDTPTAINELFLLVKLTNTYISQPPASIKIPLIE
jgi:hypothetical protein